MAMVIKAFMQWSSQMKASDVGDRQLYKFTVVLAIVGLAQARPN